MSYYNDAMRLGVSWLLIMQHFGIEKNRQVASFRVAAAGLQQHWILHRDLNIFRNSDQRNEISKPTSTNFISTRDKDPHSLQVTFPVQHYSESYIMVSVWARHWHSEHAVRA
ncbi:uncharacterized protein CLUP02_15023 [Colletotrichum lupini]|uniref:Uncharacterized protein n=1 Tax=Colletotrichum lupini TaxID=145971 RepID=A0A9Q8T772_9PEZI|nr:uncharacterized protein CLUP02_15023 [Colletotrichum lupini]UQC89492.1 hypothetical protein CLUP02_15023 [Colletotrichum lupini]